MTDQRSAKDEAARSGLPEDLRPIFDEFVAQYQYAASRRHGAPWVSYLVLADMVRAGWRLTGAPRDDVGGAPHQES
jgi:hypothetical protein